MRLTAHGVGHRFAFGNPLFENVEFDLVPGEMLAVTGPSGSGKSTLLSLASGWDTPTSGRIERDRIDKVCWVFQNPLGVARRSTRDHLLLPLLANGHTLAQARARAAELMDAFDLTPHAETLYRRLSGGQAQRLMLARALAMTPDLLLVDEPTAQLDLLAASTVNHVLRRVARRECIVIVASHDANTIATCTSVLDLGDFAPAQRPVPCEAMSAR